MFRSIRLSLVGGATILAALGLASGAVVAQDDGMTADDEPAMESMDHMEPGLTIREPWTRASMMAGVSGAGYMVIHNSADEEDTLVGASSPAAGVVEIHQSSMAEDGTMSMDHVGRVPLAAHTDTVLAPGGYHLMLIDLTEPLEEGGFIEVSLEFANAEPQTVTLPVLGMAPMGGDMDHDMDADAHESDHVDDDQDTDDMDEMDQEDMD